MDNLQNWATHSNSKGLRKGFGHGEVEFVTDTKEKEEIFNQVEWIKKLVGTADNATWTPFRIVSGRAYFWTMQTNLEKSVCIEFNLRN